MHIILPRIHEKIPILITTFKNNVGSNITHVAFYLMVSQGYKNVA